MYLTSELELDFYLWPTTLTYDPNILKVNPCQNQDQRSNCSAKTAWTKKQTSGQTMNCYKGYCLLLVNYRCGIALYLPVLSMPALIEPNVDIATNTGIIQDIEPKTSSPHVWKKCVSLDMSGIHNDSTTFKMFPISYFWWKNWNLHKILDNLHISYIRIRQAILLNSLKVLL